jgi:hypothetical protein
MEYSPDDCHGRRISAGDANNDRWSVDRLISSSLAELREVFRPVSKNKLS